MNTNSLKQKNRISISEFKVSDTEYKCPHCDKLFSKNGIGSHIWKSHTEDGLNHKPFREYIIGSKKIWNTGLTKETDSRVLSSSITVSNLYKSGSIKNWCDGKTKDTDIRLKKMSETVSKTVNEKIKNGTWHNSFSKSRTHEYNGEKFYGSWELKYAIYLDSNDIKWKKNTEIFSYFFDGSIHQYTPDFYLIHDDTYIEIKGYETKKDRAKWSQFPKKLIVLKGKELVELGIIEKYKVLKTDI
jgi:hypothetical protein